MVIPNCDPFSMRLLARACNRAKPSGALLSDCLGGLSEYSPRCRAKISCDCAAPAIGLFE